MHKIKYDIGINDNGRPCIDLTEGYEDSREDKFFAIELARYILQEVYGRRSAELDKNSGEIMESSINFLGQIGDEMAEIMWNNMRAQAEIHFLLDTTRYHVIVTSIKERDDLPEKNILAFEKLYDRRLGLKVYVINEGKIYELVNGLENENWKEI